MKDKLNKGLLIIAIVSFIAMVLGFILWADLGVLQDSGFMATFETGQTRDAIHEQTGGFLLNFGFIVFAVSLLIFSIRQIASYLNKK